MNLHKVGKNVLAAWLAAGGALGSAYAGTYSNDFSTAGTTGITLNGGNAPVHNGPYPMIENGHLVLTYAENSLGGSIVLDDLDAAAAVESFKLNFKLRISDFSGSPADGLSIFFGQALSDTNFGEEGPAIDGGLTVSFDIYDNGGGEAPAIDIKVNNVVIGSVKRSIAEITSDTFADVSIELKKNGTLSLSYKGQQLYNNVFLPGYAPAAGDRFAIGARTGGVNASQWIDDLSVTTVLATATAPSVVTPPANLTVNEGAPATFNVVFDGSAPISFQWLSNNVEIAEATAPSYTIASTSGSANGAKYKVRLTNTTGNTTSTEATLTVTSDTVKPTIISAVGNESLGGIVVTFSEPVSESTATAMANYAVSGGVTVTGVTVLSPTTVLLATSSQTPGTSYTVTVNGVQDAAFVPNTIAANSTKAFSSFVLSKGFAKWEYFFGTGIAGVGVSDLTGSTNYAGLPDSTAYISALNSRLVFPDDSHENYGARITGFIVPTETTDYRFFISSDDASQLSLAVDGNVANLAVVAAETGCCNAFTEPGTARTSEPISLTAGVAYPYEILLKEGGGGDYVQVAWRKESDAATIGAGTLQPIPSSFLAVYADPSAVNITISTDPTSRTAAENTRTTFTAAATGGPAPLTLQWQRQAPGASTFIDIPGANGTSYTTPILKLATDNGAKYRAVALVPGGSKTSAEATLTVNIDSTAPQLASAQPGENQKSVTLYFSEEVDSVTGAQAANYTIPGLTVTSAIVKTDSVILVTSQQTAGASYTVTVSGVKDSAQNLIDAAHKTATFNALVIQAGVVKYEAYYGITGTAVANLKASPKYPNAPDFTQLMGSAEEPNTVSDNYGSRLSGFVVPAETGDYRFFVSSDDASAIYVSTTDSAADLPANPSAEETGCCNAFTEPDSARTSAPIHMEAGKRYYFVYLQKEGGGGDNGKVAWRAEGDATAAADLPPIPGKFLAAALTSSQLSGFSLSGGTALGTGKADKPGFKARIHQLDNAGAVTAATSIDRAEQQLAGLLGPNAADLTTATDGVFTITDYINWNQDFATAEGGSFTSSSDPSRPDVTIPGVPGLTVNAGHNTDNIAGEITTYVEFPTAGVYYMGFNSDDGFTVTGGNTPPVNNGAVVVAAPSAAAGSYTALLPGLDGSEFPPFTKAISGKLVYGAPVDGCGPLTNAGEIAGNIALIDRGTCTFAAKALAARDAGAIACIIVNNRTPESSDGPLPSNMGGDFVNFPVVMITITDGAKIKAALGSTVNVSITPDPTPVLGQYRTGRGADANGTLFPVIVPAAGLYPMRAVWFEGGGGASAEWFSIDAEGKKVLLNDREVTTALKTYTERTGGTTTPTLSIAKSGANVVVTFTGHLYASDTVTGPYTLIPGEGSITVTPSGTSKFYRSGP